MKKYLIFFLLFLCINISYSYNFGYIKLNVTNPMYMKEFYIDKANYSYIFSFNHYGNINKSMKIEIYLNENLIYIIDDSNDGSGNYKKSVSLNVSKYLRNGKNILKIKGYLKKGNYSPYYVLSNAQISEPYTVPISNFMVFITLMILGIIVVFLYKP